MMRIGSTTLERGKLDASVARSASTCPLQFTLPRTATLVLVPLLVLVGLLLPINSNIQVASAQLMPLRSDFIIIDDDGKGGDCTSSVGAGGPIGKWDASTQTCTLRRDVRGAIQIIHDGITLDGAGHVLSPKDAVDFGVFLSNVRGVTIKNLTIRGYSIGVYTDYSSETTLSRNTIVDNGSWGVFFFSSSNNRILENTISDNGTGGIQMVSQSASLVSGNTVSSNGTYGLYLGTSSSNILRYNSIEHHTWGLNLWAHSNYNLVLHNDFLFHSSGHIFNESGNAANIFNSDAPVGGNYYDDYNSSSEGCDNTWSGRFCDNPYVFVGGQDNWPWVKQTGWEMHTDSCTPTLDDVGTSWHDLHRHTFCVTQKGDSTEP